MKSVMLLGIMLFIWKATQCTVLSDLIYYDLFIWIRFGLISP